jgi:hypothetical protein
MVPGEHQKPRDSGEEVNQKPTALQAQNEEKMKTHLGIASIGGPAAA